MLRRQLTHRGGGRGDVFNRWDGIDDDVKEVGLEEEPSGEDLRHLMLPGNGVIAERLQASLVL